LVFVFQIFSFYQQLSLQHRCMGSQPDLMCLKTLICLFHIS
jgi:hypothetical protein